MPADVDKPSSIITAEGNRHAAATIRKVFQQLMETGNPRFRQRIHWPATHGEAACGCVQLPNPCSAESSSRRNDGVARSGCLCKTAQQFGRYFGILHWFDRSQMFAKLNADR